MAEAIITRRGSSLKINGQDIISGILQGTVSKFDAVYAEKGLIPSKLANPSTLPTNNGRGISFSPDGVYLSVAHFTSPYVTIYKRAGDVFTKLTNPATLPTNAGYGISFSPDGVYLSVAHSTSPFVTIYKDISDIEIYKSTDINLLSGKLGAGYTKKGGVATDVVDMVRIFR